VSARISIRSVALPVEEAGGKMRQLLDYWDARRQGRSLQTRQDLDVLDMKDWLGYLNLYDVPPNDEIRCRLLGTHTPTFPGYFRDGFPVTEVKPKEYVEITSRFWRDTIAAARPTRQMVETEIGGFKRLMEVLRLPLAPSGSVPPIVLVYWIADHQKNRELWRRYVEAEELLASAACGGSPD
jgi:hypothetical protein